MSEPRPFHHTLLSLLLLLTVSGTTFSQIIVETVRGEPYSGTVIHEGNDSLTMVTDGGDTLRFTSADLQFLDRSGGASQGPKQYFVLGAHLGTPAYLLNFDIGYYWPGIGFRLSGAYYGGLSGIQLDAGYPLHRSADHSTDIYLAAGQSRLPAANNWEEDPTWTYIGAGLHSRWSFFFLSAGINVGTGDYSNPRFLAQLGFLWEMTQ